MVCVCRLTQGAALGYVLLPLRGVSLTAFDTPSTQSANNVAAWGWRGVTACGWRGVAAWVWQGCHTLLLIHLRRPMRMAAPTDADGCADRCRWLRRPTRMAAPTDADVCVDRCEPCREDFLALASGKAERSPSLTTLLVLPYRNNQQCIIPKKAVRHSCHTAFYIYKYRLNGNVNSVILQEQGEPSMWLLYE